MEHRHAQLADPTIHSATGSLWVGLSSCLLRGRGGWGRPFWHRMVDVANVVVHSRKSRLVHCNAPVNTSAWPLRACGGMFMVCMYGTSVSSRHCLVMVTDASIVPLLLCSFSGSQEQQVQAMFLWGSWDGMRSSLRAPTPTPRLWETMEKTSKFVFQQVQRCRSLSYMRSSLPHSLLLVLCWPLNKNAFFCMQVYAQSPFALMPSRFCALCITLQRWLFCGLLMQVMMCWLRRIAVYSNKNCRTCCHWSGLLIILFYGMVSVHDLKVHQPSSVQLLSSWEVPAFLIKWCNGFHDFIRKMAK